jgi:predicted AAA+ superfamily ATPase
MKNSVIIRQKDITEVSKLMEIFPVTAILGARQCGKTTLAKQFNTDHYFDLENPRDLARLDQPQLALEDLEGLIVIDEIQRKAELFPLLRYLVDENPKQKYLILGSASKDLIKQSSESLAGRIAYYYLGGFTLHDVGKNQWNDLWFKGGFPRSFLASDDEAGHLWRENYISTFLERDVPQLGISIPANTLRRFWIMLSHYHGQIINYSEIARSFGISDMTVRKYMDILEGTFMIRLLQPWYINIGKRVVKRPKVYLRDSGIFHTLMSIQTMEQLITQPKLGASWEGFSLELACRAIGKADQQYFFWRTHAGAELDLLWQESGKNWGIEFKYADAPRLTKSLTSTASELDLQHLWIVYPGKEEYKLTSNITALPLKNIGEDWRY